MYELIIKNGLVIDPSQGIHDYKDIGITQGKIVVLKDKLPAGKSKSVINAAGMIVTPGLIDIHAHIASGIVMGVTPDEGGVLRGITTVCDAGSLGHANFANFRGEVVSKAKTDVFSFLNLSSTGLARVPEITSWENINTEAILETLENNRGLIKGLKIRAVGAVIRNLGIGAIHLVKKLTSQAGIPLMVHIGIGPEEPVIPRDEVRIFTEELLSILNRGDILSHVFTPKAGYVIAPDGEILPELIKAIQRGVILDIARGHDNWSIDTTMAGLEKGIIPATISTDMAEIGETFPDLTTLMSQFLTLGLTLDQIIAMTTINPARALGEDQRRGSLSVGMPSDLSILELIDGNFIFLDRFGGKKFRGNRLLEPRLTIKSGIVIEARPNLSKIRTQYVTYRG